MGQAKKRGTYEERKALAMSRVPSDIGMPDKDQLLVVKGRRGLDLVAAVALAATLKNRLK